MSNSITDKPANRFEALRSLSVQGMECWHARDLQAVFDYREWRKFERVINRAIIACKTTGYDDKDHFVPLDKMVKIGSGASRKVADYQAPGRHHA